MTPLPVTLVTAASAGLVNIWLAARIVQLRVAHKVSVGDAGEEGLTRRMRAQANFIEHAPLFLILLGGLELSGADRTALAAVALLFVLARIAHGFGMDGGPLQRWRRYGMMGSTLATAIVTLWALACAGGELLGGG